MVFPPCSFLFSILYFSPIEKKKMGDFAKKYIGRGYPHLTVLLQGRSL